ncbi:hypothetical protein ACIOJD_33675 [Streptomyces sp. NPDC088116]|uniref:hypothetical protein n=1 Tax=Streptomyces sp. NPDC088116 TaxID=3365825 RepID=UPI003807D58A
MPIGDKRRTPLTARQRRRTWRWEHGGRYLNNAFTTVAAVLGWRRGPHGWTRRTTADDH